MQCDFQMFLCYYVSHSGNASMMTISDLSNFVSGRNCKIAYSKVEESQRTMNLSSNHNARSVERTLNDNS